VDARLPTPGQKAIGADLALMMLSDISPSLRSRLRLFGDEARLSGSQCSRMTPFSLLRLHGSAATGSPRGHERFTVRLPSRIPPQLICSQTSKIAPKKVKCQFLCRSTDHPIGARPSANIFARPIFGPRC
jgi:hypothetical protein